MTTPTPRTPHTAVPLEVDAALPREHDPAAPRVTHPVMPDYTPIPSPPMQRGKSGEQQLDVEGTLRHVFNELHQVKRQTRSITTPDEVDAFEKKVKRIQKWGWVWGLLGGMGAIFSAGIGYAVFIGENATDSEVRQNIEEATKEHNGGIDPSAIDPDTHAPVGHHPELREAVESNTKAVQEINTKVLPRIESSQKKMDKRTEYQFEFSRWQAQVTEAERQRKRPPKKPKRLEELESQLLLGNFD